MKSNCKWTLVEIRYHSKSLHFFVLFPEVPFPGNLLPILALDDTEQYRLVRNAQASGLPNFLKMPPGVVMALSSRENELLQRVQ